MQSYYYIGQVYVANETIQFKERERKLVVIHGCEWSAKIIFHHSTFLGYINFTF